jgi:hypothetical protein
MSQRTLTAFANRKHLDEILDVPKHVESVYSLTQHVWAGKSDDQRQESKKKNRVRLETLAEFFIDPVRGYLNRIFEKIAENEGQGFWVQAEFGVGKSHLLAATSVLAVGGPPAWDRAKQREDDEKKAGPGARVDTLWRKKVERRKIFPIVFSLEGCGGGQDRKLVDFVLDEAQNTFALREGKPLAVYPEEHLAALFLKDHKKTFRDDLRAFLADERLMRGLPGYEYDELIEALGNPSSQRDAGRVLMAFYRHKRLAPSVPSETRERLARALQDILETGYDGVFIAIDEMSEYLRRSQFTADDEDCLLVLSSTLAKAQGMPVWTLVAAQSSHTNPKKIIGPDRLREELLEHKAERFRDIVVQRTRTITDPDAVVVYHNGYRSLIPWVKQASKDEFEASFPFPPDAVSIIRDISKRLTGTRSTISFLHRALQKAVKDREKELIPLWKVFDDLMSYAETPSTSSSGAISIRNQFRNEVAALEAGQNTLKRITDGQLARSQNRTRAERILNTLFLYKLAGVAGLTKEQILDAVSDLKEGDESLEAQLGHYETILDEMRGKLRNQITFRQGRYEFVPKATGQYDDLVYAAAERLKNDPQLLWQYIDRCMTYSEADAPSPFAAVVPSEDGRLLGFKVTWHGQERGGRVTAADLNRANARQPEVDTHGNDDDFVVTIARRPMTDKAVQSFLKREQNPDPRVVVWAPADPKDAEKAILAGVLAHLVAADEHKGTTVEKEAQRQFRQEANRAYTVVREIYARGVARTSRTSLQVPTVGGVEGAIESMACTAMDTCYTSRAIDFGNRKFDAQSAVKLINGLVKRGQAVSQGDQLWSAVENFAGPLGLVRSPALDRVDPEGSPFYSAIRGRVEQRGGTGIEIKTVYNWFTGYDTKNGKESPGLTRRMVDIYLLALVQQGVIRISDKRTGSWIDRASIAAIDFKPETLRNLGRIELPRAPGDWEVFHPYIEVLVGQPAGTLGPKYQKAAADEALRALQGNCWIDQNAVERIDSDLKGLYATLGKERENPFDDLLFFWLEFADEPRPAATPEDDVFDALRRAVLKCSGVADVAALTSEHLTTFRQNHKRLEELRVSFNETSLLLLRAARLARAPIPEETRLRDIRRAQEEVLEELENAGDLILNPDTVRVRLEPRLQRLEEAYVPAYLNELMNLDALQNELAEARNRAEASPEFELLNDFAGELPEARRLLGERQGDLRGLPSRLRKSPEDRDLAETEVKREAIVSSSDKQPLTFARLLEEGEVRRTAIDAVNASPRRAAVDLAAFLRSPGLVERLAKIQSPPASLTDLLAAAGNDEAADSLLTVPSRDRKELAKLLGASLGGKTAKTLRISEFTPATTLVWEANDIQTVVDEFRTFLEGEWDETSYLKVEK